MKKLDLGAFSVSLAVKDLAASRAFYEKLGFTVTGGGAGYVMMRQGTTILGLFEGMFEKNILTFNPGLHVQDGITQDPLTDWRMTNFMDIRAIQHQLQSHGLVISSGVDEAANPDGPASLFFADPDGNAILVDQFFSRPAADSSTEDSCQQTDHR